MLPPPLLRQLRRLTLRSRLAARNRLVGAYESAVRGAGLVFADVRLYQPGDDIRRIDWNVTARTGTPHIKQFVEERERTVWLLVDGSASLFFRQKRQTAIEVAAVVAFAAGLQGDRVGLVQFTDRVEQLRMPAKGDRAARRIVRDLFTFQPKERTTSITAALAALRRKRRAVVFLISDFRLSKVSSAIPDADSVPDPFFRRALRIAARRHDVIAVTVSDPAEAELQDLGLVRLQDDETGGQLLLNSSDPRVRSAYARQAAERDAALRDLLASAGVDRVALTTAGGHLDALVALFRRRERRR